MCCVSASAFAWTVSPRQDQGSREEVWSSGWGTCLALETRLQFPTPSWTSFLTLDKSLALCDLVPQLQNGEESTAPPDRGVVRINILDYEAISYYSALDCLGLNPWIPHTARIISFPCLVQCVGEAKSSGRLCTLQLLLVMLKEWGNSSWNSTAEVPQNGGTARRHCQGTNFMCRNIMVKMSFPLWVTIGC